MAKEHDSETHEKGCTEMSGNAPLPAGMVEILKDPRVLALQPNPPTMPKYRFEAGITLKPSNPPAVGDSPYLLFVVDYEDASAAKVEWTNEPGDSGRMGWGKGFAALKVRPNFTEARAKPSRLRGAWAWTRWLITSPEFAQILHRFDPDAIETVDMDWTYTDGGKLDGYRFLDVHRLLHAYDYARSVVHVGADATRKYVRELGSPRALLAELPHDVHVFREAYFKYDVFCSRELAKALVTAGLRGFHFEDPARRTRVEF
jgi:hypothetical protein